MIDRRSMLSAIISTALLPPSLAMITPAAAQGTNRAERLWTGFSSPVGMAFDKTGNLFVAEWSAGRVSRIEPGGKRTTFADDLSGPSGLAIDAEGNIYVASYSRDEIYRFTPDGSRETWLTGLATPAGLGFDRTGRLLVANRRTNEILAFSAARIRSVAVSGLRTPVGAVQRPDNGFIVSNIGGGVTILRGDGRRIETGEALRTPGPGIAQTASGRVFVVDYGGTGIHEVSDDGRTSLFVDGLSSPVGLTVSPSGDLFSADWGNGAIYRIRLA
ncbi:NHL repeat-containing protein [Xanthobacter versatilis]|uniref:NHL repeat-containing protein n=1 Tax=Xanthobacter autotrophicus (strain ATCC BAA-1158 / Py2) TaxID=78245 RepID=UPI00372B7B87